MKPVFDTNGLATEPGGVRCYYYDAVTSEYVGWSDEYIQPGVSMPGHSTDIEPGGDETGYVSVFTGSGWRKEEDHRGSIVYSTEDNRKASTIDYIGPIRDGYTSTSPVTLFDKWDGQKWVTDKDAQHTADVIIAEQKKAALLAEATAIIAPLADAQTGGYIEDADVSKLTEWQRYRYRLTKVDTSTAPDITLPPKPEV